MAPDPHPCPSRSMAACPTAPAQCSKHGTDCPACWGKGVKWYFCSKIAAQALEKKKKSGHSVWQCTRSS